MRSAAVYSHYPQRMLGHDEDDDYEEEDEEDDEEDEDEDGDEDDDSDTSLSSALSLSFGRPCHHHATRDRLHSSISACSSASTSSASASVSAQGPSFPGSRRRIKNALVVLSTRRAITNRAWNDLWNALQTLEVVLNQTPSSDLGVFFPIYARISTDMEILLENIAVQDKDYRRGLSSSEAKALAILLQKWPKMVTEPRWGFVRQTVENVPKPIAIQTVDRPTSQLLACLEAIILLGSPRKLSLARLGLDHLPLALLNLDEVVSWYLSFEGSPTPPGRLEEVLGSIKLLDLSRNQLTVLPNSLPCALPCLESLNLSHNPFLTIPTSLTRFRYLERLSNKGTRRRKSNVRSIWTEIGNKTQTEVTSSDEKVQSLVVNCIRRIQCSLKHGETVDLSSLAAHVRRAVTNGFDCESCGQFVGPSDRLSPIYERVVLLSPAISLPSPADEGRGRDVSGSSRGKTEVMNVLGDAVSPHSLSLAERIAVAVGSRRRESTTLIIGPRRLCYKCARLHLSFDSVGGIDLDQKECECDGCEEERKIVGELGLVRWVRRKVPRNGQKVIL
ncbi:uncharacterized protein MELLADRAFT_71909 [Melampsora larici-populina 98AG31]|uniref:Uncharacterized protein n=1 Tax=Melampsora larici-populina (strain 98AG31 / pathotype 3-4-7) TaxID=747676 RepID=F4RM84_MELLP|nr:uncharacterized protein MELLADRAFT_71909 [Melampsora larici-populina 98AG31]EGG06510.1 hypothetical protein MELLADRAFT_71909 [Melampsora larici-populina 98AG31]